MIAVIGGGILGLSAAYALGLRGFEVTVFEKGPDPGGLAAPVTLSNGARVEKFYHHFFAGQQHLLGLLQDLGLEQDLIWSETRMGFCCDGKTYPFGSPRDLLGFRPLGPMDRLRFGLGALLLASRVSPRSAARQPALEWLRKVCGARATETIWEPLLKMKFGTAHDKVSLEWLRNRIRARQSGRSASGREQLGYLKGSIGAILDSLTAAIARQGNPIHLSRSVEQLVVEGQRVAAIRVDGERIETTAVIATVANPVFCQLAPMLPDSDLNALKNIRYQGTICVSVMSRRRLTDFYWINVVDRSIPFVVAVEHTNFMDSSLYGGHLIYLGKYVEREAEEWRMSDATLTKHFLTGLKRLAPAFEAEDILDTWVARDPLTQPVFTQGYTKPPMSTALQNLFIVNTSMLFPESRTVDSSIGLAKQAVELAVSRSQMATL